MTQTAKDIRKGRKYDQVLDGARAVFMVDGFEGASVDQIARAAGVSKATLYSYFPDKRLLFMEVVNAECQRQREEALNSIDMAQPPHVVLGQVGRHFLRFITSTFGVRIFRICVAEADRFPEIGRSFYDSGPAVMRAEMAQYFDLACGRGELHIPDTCLAADQFGELCKADLWPRLIFGVSAAVTDTEIDHVVDQAVAMFLARYSV